MHFLTLSDFSENEPKNEGMDYKEIELLNCQDVPAPNIGVLFAYKKISKQVFSLTLMLGNAQMQGIIKWYSNQKNIAFGL